MQSVGFLGFGEVIVRKALGRVEKVASSDSMDPYRWGGSSKTLQRGFCLEKCLEMFGVITGNNIMYIKTTPPKDSSLEAARDAFFIQGDEHLGGISGLASGRWRCEAMWGKDEKIRCVW